MLQYFLIFIALLIMELFYLKIATFKNIKDTPNYRSAHTKPTIRGGGIVVVFAFLLYALFYQPNPDYYLLLSGVLLVSIISFIDDLVTLTSKVRILVHLIAFTLIFYSLNILNFTSLITIVTIIFTYIFSIGFLNIYNFMDGINGITFLNALVSYVTLLYLNECYQIFTDSSLLISLILSTTVFGFFNFRKKAICFAGDIGSITIGFSLIYFSLKFYIETSNKLIFLIFSVYLLDGGWTIFERLIRRENIFKAHKRHLYQLLANDLKISHLYLSSTYFIIQLLVNIIIIIYLANNSCNILILSFVLLSVSYALFKIFVIKKIQNLQ